MPLSAAIDIYCERTAAGLWEEPLNLVSNGAFLVAAALLAIRVRQARAETSRTATLFALHLAVIGIGSALFHSFATGWAQIADVVPIGLFMAFYLGYALRGRLRLSWTATGLGYFAFFAASALFSALPAAWFNGSQSYLACVPALFLFSALARRFPETARRWRLAALGLTLSLLFRSIDMAICPSIPIGTHFLWHLLNGAVLYVLATDALDPLREGSAH